MLSDIKSFFSLSNMSNHKFLAYGVAAVGFVISVLLCANAIHVKKERVAYDFVKSAEEIFDHVDGRFKLHLERMDAVASLFTASESVAGHEFNYVAKNFIKKDISYEMIIFIPKGKERDVSSYFVVPEYYRNEVFTFVRDLRAFYSDVPQNAQSTYTIHELPFYVSQNVQKKNHRVITIYKTIYQGGVVKGQLISIIVADYFMSQAANMYRSLNVKLIDNRVKGEDATLFNAFDRRSELENETSDAQSSYVYRNDIELGSGQLEIEVSAKQAFLSQYNYYEAVSVFAISLFISFLIALYIYNSQKLMNSLVRARESAQKSNDLQRDFLATMSHEIRTPMNAIIGMGDLLLDEGLQDHHATRVKTIVSSAENLLQILNDILDFSKIESGKIDMEHVSFSPCEVVEDVADLHVLQAQNKGVELTVWQSSHVPEIVVGDQGRVRQVLNNLVSNAIKFTDVGHILIKIELDDVIDNDVAVIRYSVKDTGVGIPVAIHDLIFDRFRQADSSTTREFGGTGLGLAICKRLVHIMGGEIGVKSEAGKGALFWFTTALPIDHTVQAKLDTSSDFAGVRVAAIDDMPINLDIVKSYLTRWRAHVDTFDDALEAFKAIERKNSSDEPYDIILIDHLMPHINGIKFMESMRKNNDLYQSPAILVSSYKDADSDELMQALSKFDHLPKPVHPEKLKASILKALGRYDYNENVVQSSAHRSNKEESAYFKDVRILVAEDNFANQEIAEKILERMGCSVTCVGNGKEAVEMMKTFPFDLVFMDCQMPEMDGFEATRNIKLLMEKRAVTEIPIIALTANAMKGDREKCLQAGMDDYISKPVKKQEFSQAIERYYPEKRCQSPDVVVNKTSALMNVEKKTATAQYIGEYPLFDVRIYDELRDMIGDGASRSVLRRYVDAASEDVSKLSEFLDQQDYQAISRCAHKLKSASAQVGAIRLSKISNDIEDFFKQDQQDIKDGDLDVADYIYEYKGVFEESVSAIEKILEAHIGEGE